MCVSLTPKGEAEAKKVAERNFIANMKNPRFVVDRLNDAGIRQPPCHFCSHERRKTCPHAEPRFHCKDYALYSESPAEVESEFIRHATAEHSRETNERIRGLRPEAKK